MQKVARMTQWLILSSMLNIGLLSTLIYFGVSGYQQAEKKHVEPVQQSIEVSNGKAAMQLMQLSMDGLVDQLKDQTLLEEGYRIRDLALACLVDFHSFDIARALPNSRLQRRQLQFIKGDSPEAFALTCFSGLTDAEFEMAYRFAKQEQFPQTAKGLFHLLKEEESVPLKQAFIASQLYQTIFPCFHLEDPELLYALLLEAPFGIVERFYERILSGNVEVVRFLLDCMLEGSTIAPTLFMSQVSEEAILKLEDRDVALVIARLAFFDERSVLFLKQHICGVRSDGVRKLAALKLYQAMGEEPPDPYDHIAAVKRFLNLPCSTKDLHQEVLHKHIVRGGESLWKIAKMYGVEMQMLCEVNDLKENAVLSIGRELTIPK